MEAVSTQRIADARAVLQELLALKRFCALVHPILHDVPRKSGRRGTKKMPTGDYLVKLFEGGSIITTKTDGPPLADAINKALVALTRSALSYSITILVKKAQGAQGVESLKMIDDGLSQLLSATGFQVSASEHGDAAILHPSQYAMSAGVRFDGSGAKDRASAFCVEVNEVFSKAFAEADKLLASRLAAAVSAL